VESWDLLTDQTALAELSSRGVNRGDRFVVTEALGIHESGPRILAIGEALLSALGRSRRDLLMQNPKVFRHPTQNPQSSELLRRCLMTWTPVEVDVIQALADGSPVKFRLKVEPLYSDRHWYEYWLGSFQRIL